MLLRISVVKGFRMHPTQALFMTSISLLHNSHKPWQNSQHGQCSVDEIGITELAIGVDSIKLQAQNRHQIMDTLIMNE